LTPHYRKQREALRLLEARERARELAVRALRARIGRGMQQADRGEFLDGEAVFEEIRQLGPAAPER
jgi:antitoxin ParD1/3/4